MNRPEFVEPKWGTAPPPLPSEITEITWERRSCRGSCQEEAVVLRRDGHAQRMVRHGKHLDSLFSATIDSATFISLAAEVIRRNLFTGSDDDGFHEPLANNSLMISAATLCRRRVSVVQEPPPRGVSGPFPEAAIDSVARGLRWEKCCRDYR